MVRIGYTMMCEQAGPKQLVRDVVLAEQVGFDFCGDQRPLLPVARGPGALPVRVERARRRGPGHRHGSR